MFMIGNRCRQGEDMWYENRARALGSGEDGSAGGRWLPRGWGVLLGILGRGVPLGSPNPNPISDQNIPFSTPVFRPGL